jgi:hypothetical protein
MGYACEGVELCKHILCVQIGCINHGRCRSNITVVMRRSCVSRASQGTTACFCHHAAERASEN